MGIRLVRAFDCLQENMKITNAGGMDRTSDLQPSNALSAAWLPLSHFVFTLHIMNNNNNIQKHALVENCQKPHAKV